MKCLECNGNKFTMDERIGELICMNFGLIAETKLIEQSMNILKEEEWMILH